ncbi:MAG TPA: Gfo/Idh/MocA family oxidoreductase [Fimbriimonadales bacterium]|nr:Gfo/Idh/MocA family oxidoreductase [Fimbriimonadales bacterium]
MAEEEIGIGVIGFGGFAMFAVQQFLQVPGVRLKGMAGTHREAAYRAAERYGVTIEEVETMLAREDVNLVYIATPPFLHYPQGMQALQAGKHVIVEKPIALTLEQAKEMASLAREKNLLLVVNLMQRYNPLYDAMKRLIEEKPLGELLHAYFENYATDEGLPREHWFWDKEKSGGIFIEHGVHFFDMFEGWLGGGDIVCAQSTLRPGTKIEEQVQCTARYRDGITVNIYHGFHQPERMDRQEMRFLFERGDVTLFEWVPTRLRMHAIAGEKDMRTVCEIFPGGRVNVLQLYHGKDRVCSGRHKAMDVYQKFEYFWGDENVKMTIYGDLLRSMLLDQLAWLEDRSHRRKITEENGIRSLEMAIKAKMRSQTEFGNE